MYDWEILLGYLILVMRISFFSRYAFIRKLECALRGSQQEVANPEGLLLRSLLRALSAPRASAAVEEASSTRRAGLRFTRVDARGHAYYKLHVVFAPSTVATNTRGH